MMKTTKRDGAKLEAYSIFDKYFKLGYLSINQCKECSIIAVDEIMIQVRFNLAYGYEKQLYHLLDVKNEINKIMKH